MTLPVCKTCGHQGVHFNEYACLSTVLGEAQELRTLIRAAARHAGFYNESLLGSVRAAVATDGDFAAVLIHAIAQAAKAASVPRDKWLEGCGVAYDDPPRSEA